MTCKWDCPVSMVYCEAMYYPTIEDKKEEPVQPIIIETREPDMAPQTPIKTRRQTDYYGINKR